MNDRKLVSDDDSERFILPDGEVLTREQMEAPESSPRRVLPREIRRTN